MRHAGLAIAIALVISGLVLTYAEAQPSPGSTRIVSADGSKVVGVTSSSELKVTAASLPLPAGAATEATLLAVDTSLLSIDSKAPALVSGRVPVDGSGVTQPVSIGATVTTLETTPTSFDADQLAVTASAQQLPTHAAKAVCVKNLTASTQTVYLGAASVSTATGDELGAGERLCLTIDNTNRLYVRAAATGATISFSWVN